MNSLVAVLYLGADKAGVHQRTRTRSVKPSPRLLRSRRRQATQ